MTQRNTYFQDEVVKEEKIDVKNLRRLLKYVVPHKKMFCIVLALMLVAVASSLISPLILKVIINQAIPNTDHAQLALALGGIAVCGLIEIFITYFQQKKMGRMGHGLIADIRRDIFYKFLLLIKIQII